MPDFVSEAITPIKGAHDGSAMSRGEPGLPAGFMWRGEAFSIASKLSQWKQSGKEPMGEIYLRRHCYALRMSDDSTWTVYFLRQTPKSGSPKSRWFLYTIEPAGTASDDSAASDAQTSSNDSAP